MGMRGHFLSSYIATHLIVSDLTQNSIKLELKHGPRSYCRATVLNDTGTKYEFISP